MQPTMVTVSSLPYYMFLSLFDFKRPFESTPFSFSRSQVDLTGSSVPPLHLSHGSLSSRPIFCKQSDNSVDHSSRREATCQMIYGQDTAMCQCNAALLITEVKPVAFGAASNNRFGYCCCTAGNREFWQEFILLFSHHML